ncbi:Ger(x)C family spore germination protein [Evansella sp. LMS18]|uniref:Ger(x)C family spore germination protein n=1 Tax=Evansella sp. LMS18 TaxID=2924033 RepID=UPI0020D15D93|nr:Ger(x)C family spore germination protein [Evansella sp. LMS18]UTR11863.1 Ger(x)C family spore germination protein [Evansella sp. LMS18]
MKKSIVFFLTVLVILQTGCWDRVELNDVALISATGIDLEGEKDIRTSILIPLPSQLGGAGTEGGGGGTSGEQPFYIDSSAAPSLRDAKREIQSRMSRRLTLGHRRVAVISQDLAKQGISKTFDDLTRSRESRLTTLILLSREDAREVLSTNPYLEQLSSEAIREISQDDYWQSIRDILNDLLSEGNDPIIPVVDLVENETGNPEMKTKQIQVRNAGMFKNDKLIYITDEKQSEGVLWMLSKFSGNQLHVPMKEEQSFDVRVLEQTTGVDYEIVNGMPKFMVDVSAKVSVLENESDFNFEEPEVVEEAENKINEEIKSSILAVIEENKSQGIDSFGFGDRLYRKDSQKWQEWKDGWREMLPDVEVEVTVDSQIESLGLFGKSLGMEAE